jgi:hypothetical protein
MRPKITTSFCKSGVCPSAEKLLAFYRLEQMTKADSQCVSRHLAECEFCDAELHLLATYPPTEEKFYQADEYQADDMPLALRQLAEVLLGGRPAEYRLLNQLLCDKEILTLKNA